jgi:hypothetical protein
MRDYPLSRCPVCDRTFRAEVGRPRGTAMGLVFVVCPYCSHRFQRFDFKIPEGPPKRASA